ncbi:MAG: hypothetical protein ACREX8_09755, partial [Gammaproteobacteria bacterium]
FDLIPKGTLVKVRMSIRPGGYDDPNQGWTGRFATRNEKTGSVYLNCEFVVLEGDYARRKLWSLIGLHGPNGPEWARMGRAFIRACLNSARGIHPKDESPQAQSARRISGFKDLDGLEFLAKVDWEKDQNGNDKHIVKAPIGPDHKDYAALMGAARPVAAATPQASAQAPSRGSVPTRPSWAQ